MREPQISVLFVDNTAKGILAKRLQEAEKRLGGITSYRIRITEQAGMALSRLLPSLNPWGLGTAKDWTVSSVVSRMKFHRIAEDVTSCMRMNAKSAKLR